MIPLHRPLSPDHQTYLLALIEWQRALDLARECSASSDEAECVDAIAKLLSDASMALAAAGVRLSLEDRQSIHAAMAAATAHAQQTSLARVA